MIAERAGRKLVELLHRAMLRTASGPLRPLWAVVHRAAIRAAIAYLRHGEPGSAGYVAGSFGHGEPTYGLSDIDLVIAIPGDPRRHREHAGRIAGRWTRLGRRLPIAEELMFDLDAPIVRIGGPDIPAMPFAGSLEHYYVEPEPDRLFASMLALAVS